MAYDEIADWYETEFLGTGPDTDSLGIRRSLEQLLGRGSGVCLEIGCGTGVHARQVHELGWTPIGVDVSRGMLRHARGKLPVVVADAQHLPFPENTFPAVISVMAHTDMADYTSVLREVVRVLRPGGVFVHIGVHPCFCGGFADRNDPAAVILRPGYLDSEWTKASWTDKGVRAKVGAVHRPLPELLHAFLTAGFTLQEFAEGGTPVPITLSIKARKAPPGS